MRQSDLCWTSSWRKMRSRYERERAARRTPSRGADNNSLELIR